jgi:hypothetical protein
MAKNKFTDVSTLDNSETDKIAREIMDDADLKTTTDNKHNRGGRKAKEIKADKTVRVYVTTDQKTAIELYCSKTGMSESMLVKQLLIKEGVL